MSDILDAIATTREQAHDAVTKAYAFSKLLIADGKRARIRVEEDVDDLSIRQRKFLHGPVLGQIAEQVRMPDGTRYVQAVWKEYFRALFLPDRWVLKAVPRWDPELRALVAPKRKTPRRERRSTEDLNVRQYSELIDKILAHAATELGVEFELDPIERDGVRYVSKRAAKRVAQETQEAMA